MIDPKNSPLAAQTIYLVMELNCLYRHPHRQIGGSDFRYCPHDRGRHPDHHRGRCNCGYPADHLSVCFLSSGGCGNSTLAGV